MTLNEDDRDILIKNLIGEDVVNVTSDQSSDHDTTLEVRQYYYSILMVNLIVFYYFTKI